MKIENNNEALRLEFFKELYQCAANAYGEYTEGFDRAIGQYRGSKEIDGSDESALTVRNITYEIVESQVSSDIPLPKADAASYSERRGRNAASIERLCRSVRDKLPFDEMNDLDERYTYIYGGSVWYLDWDNSTEYMGEVGGVSIRCLPPSSFIPQPNICTIDDMEYCFLKFTTTRGELTRKYGISAEDASRADYEFEYNGELEASDAVKVITCFYRDEDGEIGRYIFSGDLILSDLPKYYMRKRYVCSSCGNEAELCRCKHKKTVTENVNFEEIREDVILHSGSVIPAASPEIRDGYPVIKGNTVSMSVTKIPYYVPKLFPIVIRKNTSKEGSFLGQSDCDYIRPQQQAINKIESRILQKLLRAGITPIMPEDATVALNNSVFGQVIKAKPGESLAQYGKVDTTPNIAQDIAEAERLYDHAKRVIGISDAYQGIDTGSAAESGYAKQLRINQATGRLESKRKMKHAAYARIDKIIFSLYLAFADEPRRLSYKDAYGRIHEAEFNRYDFIEYDLRTGSYYYDDEYLFSVDLNGGNEYQREALWQRNLDNLKAGTLGDPSSPVTLLRYWQCQERAHYPHARENVEYFTEIQNEEGGVRYVE